MAKKSRKAAARVRARQAALAAYSYRPDDIEAALESGEHAQELEACLGEKQYRELRQLAGEARRRVVRGGPRVLILPGIMGSTVGKRRPLIDDVIWFDPIDVAAGNLVDLALTAAPPRHTSLGVVSFAYTALKLRLQIAGFDADYHHFDWRLSIDKLGQRLVERLNRESSREVNLVAHSMGGLVARAAIARGARKIRRFVMLGTPNHGSFAPVQAIRAVYPVVRQVAAIDLFHTPEQLATQMFCSFPGLYQMLPTPEKFGDVDLYDGRMWPQTGPQPRQPILDGCRPVQQLLAKADERYFLVAGVNQETVVSLRMEDGEFVYEHSPEGDGTVPLRFALLEGAKTYYVEESHGGLPNNGTVARAVADILNNGATEALAARWSPARRGVLRTAREADLRVPAFDGRRGMQLSQSEMRQALEPLLSPVARAAAPRAVAAAEAVPGGEAGFGHRFTHVVVGRRRQHRIDLRLAFGSITEVDARAYVLGVFRDVAPSGPARALDGLLDGAISDLTARRMFTGNVGEIFMLPTGRHPVRADVILFAGLGHFDRFGDEVQQLTAENVIRTCIRIKAEEFATVLLGAGSGHGTVRSLQNLLTGFFRGLRDADHEHFFQRVTLCATNRERYDEMKQELYRLSSTALFDDVEVTLDEITVPAAAEPAVPTRAGARGPEPVYLIARQDTGSDGKLVYQSSILTAGSNAAVISGSKSVARRALDAHLKKIESPTFTVESLDAFGETLAELVLADDVATALRAMKDRHVVVVHDAPSSRIPWETVRIGGWSPASSDAGLSRRYLTANLSVAKWLEQRQHGPVLDLLLVVNPTEDLEGAEREGKRVRDLFGSHPSVKIDELRGAQATRDTLLAKFRSGEYDVIHYAGHAFFDADNRSRSGILCHGGTVVSGADLAGVGNLPSLVFFNACEAGRIRRGAQRKERSLDIERRIERSVSLAEAFLRGGVANYVGTYWPVGDAAAEQFATTFYSGLLKGQSIGAALAAGRAAVRGLPSVDWADYMHYGSYEFVLKQP